MDADIRQLRLRTGITVPCLVQDAGGTGTPLLLLHAWGESRKSFDRLIPLLAGCRIYAPDLRGQGDAEKPINGYSLAEQAEDAARPGDHQPARGKGRTGSSDQTVPGHGSEGHER